MVSLTTADLINGVAHISLSRYLCGVALVISVYDWLLLLGEGDTHLLKENELAQTSYIQSRKQYGRVDGQYRKESTTFIMCAHLLDNFLDLTDIRAEALSPRLPDLSLRHVADRVAFLLPRQLYVAPSSLDPKYD
ncbi:hypothetical protein FRC17_003628 [Serendipita sp. 399]|nr:hypothetical protein FRC17_003628 [Serendipita sp. 399]